MLSISKNKISFSFPYIVSITFQYELLKIYLQFFSRCYPSICLKFKMCPWKDLMDHKELLLLLSVHRIFYSIDHAKWNGFGHGKFKMSLVVRTSPHTEIQLFYSLQPIFFRLFLPSEKLSEWLMTHWITLTSLIV